MNSGERELVGTDLCVCPVVASHLLSNSDPNGGLCWPKSTQILLLNKGRFSGFFVLREERKLTSLCVIQRLIWVQTTNCCLCFPAESVQTQVCWCWGVCPTKSSEIFFFLEPLLADLEASFAVCTNLSLPIFSHFHLFQLFHHSSGYEHSWVPTCHYPDMCGSVTVATAPVFTSSVVAFVD